MTAGREGEVLVGVGGEHGRAVLVLPAGDGTCNTTVEVRHSSWHQIVVAFINFYIFSCICQCPQLRYFSNVTT